MPVHIIGAGLFVLAAFATFAAAAEASRLPSLRRFPTVRRAAWRDVLACSALALVAMGGGFALICLP